MRRPPAVLPSWLLAELGPTSGLAAVLAGSTPGAADLVAETLARDRSWLDVDEGFDLTPRLRTAVTRTFLSSPLGRSRPPAAATGLDALAGSARVSVVLRDGERLTIGEISTILDLPARRVTADLGALPPGAHDDEIAELRSLAPAAEEITVRLGAVSTGIRRARRRRHGLLAAAAIVVGAAVAVPTLVLPRLPAEVREPGVWRYSHEVVLDAGWQLSLRTIEAETETSVVLVPWVTDDPAPCTVTVRVRGIEPDRPDRARDPRPVSVHGRPGEVLTRPGNALTLSWEYADDAWATVECAASAAVTPEVLLDLAAATRFRDVRQPLPFTMSGLPEGYRIQTVGESFTPLYGDTVWGPVLLLAPPEDSYRAAILVGPDLSGSNDSASSCLGTGELVCVSAFQTDDQVPPNRGLLRRTVAITVEDVRPAPDPADRSTWFDAITLPTG